MSGYKFQIATLLAIVASTASANLGRRDDYYATPVGSYQGVPPAAPYQAAPPVGGESEAVPYVAPAPESTCEEEISPSPAGTYQGVPPAAPYQAAPPVGGESEAVPYVVAPAPESTCEEEISPSPAGTYQGCPSRCSLPSCTSRLVVRAKPVTLCRSCS